MKTDKIEVKNIHHGHNIKRIREARNIKQFTMADEMKLSQQMLSKLENKRKIDDETLQKIADYLHIDLQDLKELEDYPTTIIFENNTNNIETNNGTTATGIAENNATANNDPALDKITELYERMLKEERDRNEMLQKKSTSLEARIVALEKQAKEK